MLGALVNLMLYLTSGLTSLLGITESALYGVVAQYKTVFAATLLFLLLADYNKVR